MDTTQEPLEAISAWQKWYKEHRVVAQMDQPLVTKDSRQNLHNTTNTAFTMNEAETKNMWIQKAQEHFEDTLAEYQYELTGKDFFKAFYRAAYQNAEYAKKEYDRAQELVDLLRYKDLGWYQWQNIKNQAIQLGSAKDVVKPMAIGINAETTLDRRIIVLLITRGSVMFVNKKIFW